jgi:hypothetical protein
MEPLAGVLQGLREIEDGVRVLGTLPRGHEAFIRLVKIPTATMTNHEAMHM